MVANREYSETSLALDEPRGDDIMRVRDLNVTFEMDRGQSRVLKDVSMDIKAGEILGVVGESGSGKSMFASALLDAVVDPGVLRGEVSYFDGSQEVDVLAQTEKELRAYRWEEVSMVFQGALNSFNPTMKIGDHFLETLDAHNYERKGGMERARELLEDLYLEPDRILNSYPHELSGGMRQRALIALSLLLDPNVLVMDEPTAALDLLMQRSILDLIEELQEKYDLTVVFITHDLPLVAGIADRIGVMYAFEFVEVAPVGRILDQPNHPYTRSLLKAVPTLHTPLDEMEPIAGSSPDPVNIPSGCTYRERCQLATDRCQQEDPALVTEEIDHRVACFHAEDSVEKIPLVLEAEESTAPTLTNRGRQSTEPILELDEVTVHFEEQAGGLFDLFREHATIHAVDDVSLEIFENDVVALVGESGCGKTTLGKTAIGAVRPSDGEIRYRRQEIWEAKKGQTTEIPFSEIRRSLQMIHQDPDSSLNPNRKVQKILEAPLVRWEPELTKQARRDRVFQMLDYVGMKPAEDYAGRYPHQLSGGEKQRVALIRALLMNPDVILADEAVSALDVSLRVLMMDLMLELQDLIGTSFIFISHNLSNARYLSANVGGRIGVMYLGQLVEIGPAEAMINDPQHPYTQLLKWATVEMDREDERSEAPVEGIDIPDAKSPPSGCRFHTRCPHAREACAAEQPPMRETESGTVSACFLAADDDHPYWESDPIQNAE